MSYYMCCGIIYIYIYILSYAYTICNIIQNVVYIVVVLCSLSYSTYYIYCVIRAVGTSFDARHQRMFLLPSLEFGTNSYIDWEPSEALCLEHSVVTDNSAKPEE